MLFADIVGYSKLNEHVIQEFVEVFLERVSQLVSSSKHRPRAQLKSRKLLGKAQAVCSPSCKELDAAQTA